MATGEEKKSYPEGYLATTSQPKKKGGSEALERAESFYTVRQSVGWTRGAILDSVRFKWVDNGVQVLFKAHKAGESKVAFVNAKDLESAIGAAGLWAKNDWLVWRKDKYSK